MGGRIVLKVIIFFLLNALHKGEIAACLTPGDQRTDQFTVIISSAEISRIRGIEKPHLNFIHVIHNNLLPQMTVLFNKLQMNRMGLIGSLVRKIIKEH